MRCLGLPPRTELAFSLPLASPHRDSPCRRPGVSRLSQGRGGGPGWLDVKLWVPHSVMLTTVVLAWLAPGCRLTRFPFLSHPGQAGPSGVADGGESKQGRADQACPLFPQVAYFQSALDKLNEAIKLAKVELRKGLAALQSPERMGSEPGGLRGVLALALVRAEPHIPALQGQPDTVQDALRFTMDVIGGK